MINFYRPGKKAIKMSELIKIISSHGEEGEDDSSDDECVKKSEFLVFKKEYNERFDGVWRAIGGLDTRQKAQEEFMQKFQQEMHQMNLTMGGFIEEMKQMKLQIRHMGEFLQKIINHYNL